MLWRKKEKVIKEWLVNGKDALLVTGARQIGKTYLIQEILKKENIHYIEFNLIEQPEVVEVLKGAIKMDIKSFISRLSVVTSKELIKGETVIFFDEVQEFKDILTSIKFLVSEGLFKYILSGSLLGVELRNLRSAPVGFLTICEMFPMDFEEFLVAVGLRREIIEDLKDSFRNLKPVDEFVHKKIMETFYTYLVVGGMPAAVKTYVDEYDFNKVSMVHNRILSMYKSDFTKYELENKKLKLQKSYDLIPSELASKNKRYTFTNLDKELKMERYIESFEWLINAGVAIPVYNVIEPKIPLEISKKSNLFKFFLSDVGMLSTLYGRATIIKVLNKEKSMNCGALFENVIAQELKNHGYKIYYFNSKKQGELDFVIEYENECVPVEIKSGKDYTNHSALNNVLSNENYNIKKAFVLSNNNIKVDGKIIYLPVYMIMFLDETRDPIPQFERIDLSQL